MKHHNSSRQFIPFIALFALLIASSAIADKSDAVKSETKTEQSASETNPKLAPTAPATGEQLKWKIQPGAGSSGSSTNYKLRSISHHTSMRAGSSTGYGLRHGYLQNFAPHTCCNLAGDADNGNTVNIGDVTFIIARLFSGGAPPVCCEEGDADSSSSITIGDVSYIISYLFRGGASPICGPSGMGCTPS